MDGREGDCWNPDTDQAKLLAAIADVESHFLIDRHRVILGGYSSGGDLSYPIAGVRQETDAMAAAGFPITRIERPGTHYDDDTDTTGTDHDLRTLLLPHIDDGWRSP